MKQKDAVFSAITSVLSENGVTFTSGSNVSTLLNKGYRSQVTNILVAQFQAGEIELDSNFPKDNVSRLRGYVSGLISNWVRKDTRLNGNVDYTPKAPGSRKGQGDPQLKALRALYSQATTAADRSEIQGYIDTRLSEIAAAKVSRKQVDVGLLPAELAAKLNL